MASVSSTTSRLNSERGAELIEFALIFPLLLLVMLGIVEFGFLFQRYEVLTNATREGVRIAVLPNYTEADVKRRVCAYLTNGGVPTAGCPAAPTNPVVTLSNTTVPMAGGATLQAKQVQVVYTHNYMFVGGIISMMGGSFSSAKAMTTKAIMRTEIQNP